MDEIEIIDALRGQRRVLQATAQGTTRKMQRVSWLNENDYDYGEESVRLGHLQPDIPILRSSITKSIRLIRSGNAKGEEASKLYNNIAEEVEFARGTLDDIKFPKLHQILASERYNAY